MCSSKTNGWNQLTDPSCNSDGLSKEFEQIERRLNAHPYAFPSKRPTYTIPAAKASMATHIIILMDPDSSLLHFTDHGWAIHLSRDTCRISSKNNPFACRVNAKHNETNYYLHNGYSRDGRSVFNSMVIWYLMSMPNPLQALWDTTALFFWGLPQHQKMACSIMNRPALGNATGRHPETRCAHSCIERAEPSIYCRHGIWCQQDNIQSGIHEPDRLIFHRGHRKQARVRAGESKKMWTSNKTKGTIRLFYEPGGQKLTCTS